MGTPYGDGDPYKGMGTPIWGWGPHMGMGTPYGDGDPYKGMGTPIKEWGHP